MISKIEKCRHYYYEFYQKLEEQAIKSYNYKPEPIFYGSGPLFMGVELEIDKGGEDNRNAESLININDKIFIATLQLIGEICKLAIKFTDKELEGLPWVDFVIQVPKEKEELIDYLKAKRLYVNETTEGSEGI